MADETRVAEESQGQPAEQQAQPETAPKPDATALLARLEALGISDEKKLNDVFATSRGFGQMAQTLGAARQRIQELESALSRNPQLPQQPQGSDQPIDLRRELKSAIRDFYRDEVFEPQRQAQTRLWQEVEQINQSEHFPLVKDKWLSHIQSPVIQRRLSAGETTLTREYGELVLREYRDIAIQAKEAIKSFSQEGVRPPHIESGSRAQPAAKVGDRDERKEQILKKWTGTDVDIDKMLDLVFEKPK